MTAVPFIVALAGAAAVCFVLASLRGSKDALSAPVLLRLYLHIAAFVSLVVCVTGLIYLATGLASLALPDFSYARQLCLPNEPPRAQANLDLCRQQAIEFQLDRQSTDLIRGATLAVVGGVLLLAHALIGRRTPPSDAASSFLRGFLAIGLVTFGIVGLVALPVGLYQALKFFLTTPLATQMRVAPANTLATGVILTPLWAWFLIRLARVRA